MEVDIAPRTLRLTWPARDNDGLVKEPHALRIALWKVRCIVHGVPLLPPVIERLRLLRLRSRLFHHRGGRRRVGLRGCAIVGPVAHRRARPRPEASWRCPAAHCRAGVTCAIPLE